MSFMDGGAGAAVSAIDAAVERALAIDPEQAMALRTRAIVVGKCLYDADQAEALFQRALRTMPHFTSARLNFAEILTLAGRFDEALAQLGLARIHDPLSATVHLARAICLGYARRFDDARNAWALCRAAGETSLWYLHGAGMNELAAGKIEAAAALLAEGATRFPDLPIAIVGKACLHAARGERGRAQALVDDCAARFPHYSPANLAVVAAMMGDREKTLRLLGDALDRRDMALPAATMFPALDWLADDPALRQLAKRCPIWERRSAVTAAA
jgi:Tfp pilus assembly protein PilF